MSYVIEVMATGEDVYPLLGRAAATLNGVQTQFEFRLTPTPMRADGLGFVRSAYATSEIWKFLREQRERLGGHRPYVIAFIQGHCDHRDLVICLALMKVRKGSRWSRHLMPSNT
jgi:hypothetical protein